MARGFNWTPRRVALLGTKPDSALAKRLEIGRSTVHRERQLRGIPPAKSRRYSAEEEAEITRMIEKLAKKLRRKPTAIARKILDIYL